MRDTHRYPRMLAYTRSVRHALQTLVAQHAHQNHRCPNRLCLAMFPAEDSRLGQNKV